MRRSRVLALVLVVGVLSACGAEPFGTGAGGSGPEDPGREAGREGVVEVLSVVAPALVAGDGPRVCSLVAASGQRNLEKHFGSETCVQAVGAAAGTPESRALGEVLGAGVDPDAVEVELAAGTAVVTGDLAAALTAALGTTELGLVRVEGRWALR